MLPAPDGYVRTLEDDKDQTEIAETREGRLPAYRKQVSKGCAVDDAKCYLSDDSCVEQVIRKIPDDVQEIEEGCEDEEVDQRRFVICEGKGHRQCGGRNNPSKCCGWSYTPCTWFGGVVHFHEPGRYGVVEEQV